ncbi:hypothetical protein PENSPDRAFT_688508 [Peniophora sp. CONT]|nr:hypothetical protein PENSPDRAFT_688508 [Peniophora sp. CONT]
MELTACEWLVGNLTPTRTHVCARLMNPGLFLHPPRLYTDPAPVSYLELATAIMRFYESKIPESLLKLIRPRPPASTVPTNTQPVASDAQPGVVDGPVSTNQSGPSHASTLLSRAKKPFTRLRKALARTASYFDEDESPTNAGPAAPQAGGSSTSTRARNISPTEESSASESDYQPEPEGARTASARKGKSKAKPRKGAKKTAPPSAPVTSTPAPTFQRVMSSETAPLTDLRGVTPQPAVEIPGLGTVSLTAEGHLLIVDILRIAHTITILDVQTQRDLRVWLTRFDVFLNDALHISMLYCVYLAVRAIDTVNGAPNTLSERLWCMYTQHLTPDLIESGLESLPVLPMPIALAVVRFLRSDASDVSPELWLAMHPDARIVYDSNIDDKYRVGFDRRYVDGVNYLELAGLDRSELLGYQEAYRAARDRSFKDTAYLRWYFETHVQSLIDSLDNDTDLRYLEYVGETTTTAPERCIQRHQFFRPGLVLPTKGAWHQDLASITWWSFGFSPNSTSPPVKARYSRRMLIELSAVSLQNAGAESTTTAAKNMLLWREYASTVTHLPRLLNSAVGGPRAGMGSGWRRLADELSQSVWESSKIEVERLPQEGRLCEGEVRRAVAAHQLARWAEERGISKYSQFGCVTYSPHPIFSPGRTISTNTHLIEIRGEDIFDPFTNRRLSSFYYTFNIPYQSQTRKNCFLELLLIDGKLYWHIYYLDFATGIKTTIKRTGVHYAQVHLFADLLDVYVKKGIAGFTADAVERLRNHLSPINYAVLAETGQDIPYVGTARVGDIGSSYGLVAFRNATKERHEHYSIFELVLQSTDDGRYSMLFAVRVPESQLNHSAVLTLHVARTHTELRLTYELTEGGGKRTESFMFYDGAPTLLSSLGTDYTACKIRGDGGPLTRIVKVVDDPILTSSMDALRTFARTTRRLRFPDVIHDMWTHHGARSVTTSLAMAPLVPVKLANRGFSRKSICVICPIFTSSDLEDTDEDVLDFVGDGAIMLRVTFTLALDSSADDEAFAYPRHGSFVFTAAGELEFWTCRADGLSTRVFTTKDWSSRWNTEDRLRDALMTPQGRDSGVAITLARHYRSGEVSSRALNTKTWSDQADRAVRSLFRAWKLAYSG